MMIFRLVVLLAAAAVSFADAAEDAIEIVRRSVQADQRTLEKAKDYTFQQTNVQRDLDAQGRVRSTETRTYEVFMMYGQSFRKLVAVNGTALPAGKAAQESERLQKQIDKRKNESPSERARRERDEEKEADEIRRVAAEIPNAHRLTITGEETIAGRPAWIIDAEPRPEYKTRDSRARFITKMRGRLWIDKADYHWAKLEAEPVETISYGLVLARLSPGTRIQIEQMRVNDEIWVPARIRVKLDARLALLKRFRKELEVTYRDYRKFRTDSRVVETAELPANP